MAVRSSSRSESNRLGALIVGGLLLTILAVAILSSVIAKRQLDEAAREQVAITVAQERVDDLLRAQLDEESALREALAARRAGGDPYIEMEDPFIPLTSVLEAELRGIDVPQALALTSEIAQTHKNWIEGVAERQSRPVGIVWESLGRSTRNAGPQPAHPAADAYARRPSAARRQDRPNRRVLRRLHLGLRTHSRFAHGSHVAGARSIGARTFDRPDV